MKKAFVAAFLLMLVLASCRHTTPFVGEEYFQALGEDGEYVLTADMDRLRNGELGYTLDTDGILDRADRVSLSLVPGNGAILDSFVVSGALEGNYGKTMTNTALKLSSAFHSDKVDGVRSYTDGNLSVASPKSGIVLFTEGDYASFRERTMDERAVLIDGETAEAMASSVFALYVKNPETLVDLGFEIPKTVLAEIGKTLLLFTGQDGKVILSGRLEMKDNGSARAILTLLKNQILQEAKRKGETLDYKVASTYFVQDDDVVLISGYPLSGTMLENGNRIVSSSLGGLN